MKRKKVKKCSDFHLDKKNVKSQLSIVNETGEN